MPRKPRAHLAGGIFHVTSRGNRGVDLFLDEVTRLRFLRMLQQTIARSSWRCLAYCLMTNHFHLVVTMEKPTLSAGMHWLNGCYAQWLNRRHGFKGHLFEDRFHSEPVESEAHLLELSRYLPLNPVRAGICSHRPTGRGRATTRPSAANAWRSFPSSRCSTSSVALPSGPGSRTKHS